jgi:hypothetical protein
MQSLCAGSAESGERLLGFRARSPDRVEGCGSPVETSVRSAEAPTEPEARQRLSRLRAAAIAQLNGVAPFSTGYFLPQKAQECKQLHCRNPSGGSNLKKEKVNETNKAQWKSREECGAIS